MGPKPFPAGRPSTSRAPDSRVSQPVLEGAPPVVSIAGRALSEIAAALQTSLNAAAVAIALESGGVFHCRAAAGDAAPEVGTRISHGEGITWECISTATAIACPDTDADPRVNAAVCRQFGIRSLLLLPIKRKGEVVGVVEAMCSQAHGFPESALESLLKAAQQIVSRVYGEGSADAASEQTAELSFPDLNAEAPLQAENTATPSASVIANDLPIFAGAAQPPPRSYAIMIAVAVVCVAMLVAGIVLRSHLAQTDAVPSAAATPAAPAPDVPESPQVEVSAAQSEQAPNLPAADEAAAAIVLRRSAERGAVDAQYELALALESGRGVAADLVEACTWYLVAGMAGSAPAELAYRRLTPQLSDAQIGRVRLLVGELFAEGQAVPRDPISAYRWFFLADAAGEHQAQSAMARLSAQMTPEEIADARAQAQAWLSRHRAPSVRASTR